MPFSFKPEEVGGTVASTIPQVDSATISVPQPTIKQQENNLSAPSTVYSYGVRSDQTKGGFFQIIIYVIFGLTVLTAIGTFAYQQYLSNEVDSKKQELENQEKKLGQLPLNDMRRLSNRIDFINQLVQNHASVRAAFRIIEITIENPVVYKNFDLRADSSSKAYNLNMFAIAKDYHSAIQQISTLQNKLYSRFIPNVSIESPHPDDKGNVTFNIKIPINITGILPEDVTIPSQNIDIPTSDLVAPTTTPDVVGTSNSSDVIATSTTSSSQKTVKAKAK